MNGLLPGPRSPRAVPLKVGMALTTVYLSWGTTYLAIREGVKVLPPGLFGGTRVLLAGLVLLAYLLGTGKSVALSGRDGFWYWLIGCTMFVGGNGLINVAQKTVPSGVTSVLVATTPLWMALLEMALPHGDRLAPRGWLGLGLGLIGMAVLVSSRISPEAMERLNWLGPCLILASAFSWALGSVLQHRRPFRDNHLAVAAWQMVLGGASLAIVGLACGEASVIGSLDHVPVRGLLAFAYLLVVGSLLGFVAYVWLLGHVSAALAGTYAYVNPVVALMLGWLVAGEPLTATVVAGMVVILAGVGLVRTGALPGVPSTRPIPPVGAECPLTTNPHCVVPETN